MRVVFRVYGNKENETHWRSRHLTWDQFAQNKWPTVVFILKYSRIIWWWVENRWMFIPHWQLYSVWVEMEMARFRKMFIFKIIAFHWREKCVIGSWTDHSDRERDENPFFPSTKLPNLKINEFINGIFTSLGFAHAVEHQHDAHALPDACFSDIIHENEDVAAQRCYQCQISRDQYAIHK